MSDLSFTHLDPLGRARMVDVTPKEATHRRAVARCKVMMKPETTLAIANREVKKGDVLSVARVAGIQAAKRTSDMIPLCHPLLVGQRVGQLRHRRRLRRGRGPGRHRRSDRRRDGSAARLCDGGADDLRHVQVGRPRHGDRRPDVVGEDRRPIGTYRRPEAAATGDGDGGERSDPPIDVPEGTTVVASSSANVVES